MTFRKPILSNKVASYLASHGKDILSNTQLLSVNKQQSQEQYKKLYDKLIDKIRLLNAVKSQYHSLSTTHHIPMYQLYKLRKQPQECMNIIKVQ